MCDKSLLATGNAVVAAIAIAVFVLCVLPVTIATETYEGSSSPGVTADDPNIAAEIQQFRIAALARFDNFMQHKLPENKRAEGEALRAEMIQKLERCAQLATGKEEMWRFRKCGGEELGNSLQSLGLLVKEAYSGSEKLVIHAIWLNLTLLVAFLLK